MKITTWLFVTLAVLSTNLVAAKSSLDAAGQVKIVNSLQPSLVQVEFYLQHDKGELPNQTGWGERCPDCGQFHRNGIEDAVKNEQPLTSSGFLVDGDRVIAKDLQIHPRFIKSIHVRHGSASVKAAIAGYAVEHNSVLLELQQPLPGSKPLKFEPKKKGPYFAVQYQPLNGQWHTALNPVSSRISVPAHTEPFISLGAAALLVDKDGTPVGISMKNELPMDDSWKGSPLQSWTILTGSQMSDALAALDRIAGEGLVRVKLNFRSPQNIEQNNRFGYNRFNEDDNETEKDVPGIVVAPTRVLILANLKPKVTARLERIMIYDKNDQPITGTFYSSLKDYGALVATTDSPVGTPIEFSNKNILQERNTLLLAASVAIKGEKRVAYYWHNRIASFKFGWRNQVYPEIGEQSDDIFLFNRDNQLVALPIARREKISTDRFSPSAERVLTAAQYLYDITKNLSDHTDPANVPLTEEEENRLAWMGIELQAMSSELAKVNHVSDLTRDGEVGALVTYVYPDSPAAKAGIEPGYILLRLRTKDNPVPLEIQLEDNPYMESFPWDRLDEVQDRYFERIPTPWPSVENAFTRQLTDLGIGTEYTAEFFHDGQIIEKNFMVVAGPNHYNSAPRYKSDALGLTVRNITYEVQRYLQRRPDEPGVVISRIEAGSKASVSGIKPYEIITHINDQPVNSIEEFEALLSQPGDLNFTIKRMAKGRIVKISAPTAASAE